MGSIFGKETVAEPSYEVLLERNHHVHTSYEIRRYGERFAATCAYPADSEDTSSPFRALAGYIGVFGKPQNEGHESISMTAPVVIENGNGGDDDDDAGEKISMTAPVVTETNGNGEKVMKFMLPEEYNELSKIPKPTNPAVCIEAIPPATGVVHRYHGSMDEDHNEMMAKQMADQLIEDGVMGMSEDFVMNHFQFWGYNPPFTIPVFRRNEVWVQLEQEQVDYLMDTFSTSTTVGVVGGLN